MMIPDVNLLLYAHIASFSQHQLARKWWETWMNGQDEIGVPAPSLFGFIRVATNRRVFDPPMRVETAVEHAQAWFELPQVHLLTTGPRHLEIAFSLLRKLGVAGNLTTDAQLAAFTIEHQAELHSTDTDFGRFPGLRWVNPLAG